MVKFNMVIRHELYFGGTAMYYIGVDLGGTNIAVGVVDNDGRILYKDSVPTLREREYPEIVKDMAQLILKVIEHEGISIKDVDSIGVGCPGTPDRKAGILVYANNLKFDNAPLRDELQKYINIPVYIDNDANVAALAESVAGAARGAAHSVTITLGTGVGSGIIIDGKVYSGFNDSGAEIGHTVICIDGEPCTCGRNGCWEAYASATALINQTRAAAKNNPDSLLNTITGSDINKIEAKTAFDAAHLGDNTALKVIDKYIAYLAEGITNVINIFQPEILCIGGGVCKQGEYLLKPLRERVFQRVYSRGSTRQCQIKVAEMGNDAGIVGAAMLGKIGV